MEHRINADREFFGFKLRTRRHYHDDHILKSCLDEELDCYRMPKNPSVVVDIGANIGCISLVAARRGARVFAFEPASDNFETLEHNIKINEYDGRVTCINKGVGKPGETKLYIHPRNSGATTTFMYEDKGYNEDDSETIDIISIHDVFMTYSIKHCDLLKLDCEGSEKDIIRDLDDELVSKIGQISLEFHGNKHERAELINILSKWYDGENTRRYEWTFRKKI